MAPVLRRGGGEGQREAARYGSRREQDARREQTVGPIYAAACGVGPQGDRTATGGVDIGLTPSDPMLRLAALALLVSLAGCADPEPTQTLDGISPEQNGTLQPDASTSPHGGLSPAPQQDPSATLAPDATLQPDTAAAPGP